MQAGSTVLLALPVVSVFPPPPTTSSCIACVHGYCQLGTCQCYSNWTGPDCNDGKIPIQYLVMCVLFYSLNQHKAPAYARLV